MLRFLMLPLFAMIITGCTDIYSGFSFKDCNLDHFAVNKSTKTEVTSELGLPSLEEKAGDISTLYYFGTFGEENPLYRKWKKYTYLKLVFNKEILINREYNESTVK